jgi:nucleotide-binding universal stress UspA family protein
MIRGEAKARHIKAGLVSTVGGEPWRAILDTAKKRKCDLIVMASHGRSGVTGFLLGSETNKVLAHATIPVLVCR